MANIASGLYFDSASAGGCRYSLQVYASERLLGRIFSLTCTQPNVPLHGLILGNLEQDRVRTVASLNSSIVLGTRSWNPEISTTFAEEDFLEAFESNQMKFGGRILLGWFAASNLIYPTVFEVNTQRKFFRRMYHVFLSVDSARERCKLFRFFEGRPVPVPLRIFRKNEPARTFHTLRRRYGLRATAAAAARPGKPGKRKIWHATTEKIIAEQALNLKKPLVA